MLKETVQKLIQSHNDGANDAEFDAAFGTFLLQLTETIDQIQEDTAALRGAVYEKEYMTDPAEPD